METTTPPDTGRFGPAAVTVLWSALAQALALNLLMLGDVFHAWPATQPAVFAAAFLALLLAPLLVIQAAGQVPGPRLAAWATAAAALAAVVGAHDVLRHAPQALKVHDGFDPGLDQFAEIFPAPVFFAAFLFIAQALIVAAALERRGDRRPIAAYATYFDVAWKQAVQVVAGAGFTAVFWIVLFLGASLFKLIGLDFLSTLIAHTWFFVPATTLAFAAALHITDVRPQIIGSIKTLILTLLSWLLPLAAVIAAGFLASLPFTGLAPLWATKAATPILLGCSAGLIILLNAGYQDGAPERAVPKAMRAVGSLAAVLIFPMVAIAAYGLALRVGQYGWTKDRVIAAACVLVAACYAGGYLWAALRRDGWLKPLETCNIATSFVALAVILALFTPVADPARLAAASQTARLESGAVAPEQFDFASLRFDDEGYGVRALQALQAGGETAYIKAEAGRVLAQKVRETARAVVELASLGAALEVNPPGRRLPEGFLDQDWNLVPEAAVVLAACQKRPAGDRCGVVPVDLDGDGADEVVLFQRPTMAPVVFGQRAGVWQEVGVLPVLSSCGEAYDALRRGGIELSPAPWKDLVTGGERFPVIPRAVGCGGQATLPYVPR